MAESEISNIKGIGPKAAKTLEDCGYNTIEKIANAKADEMAQLPGIDRVRIRRGLARYWSSIWEELHLSKSELLAAVDATDTFIDDNQAAYNSALPEVARTHLMQEQKVLLFCTVALARVSIACLRRIFGEVN